MYKHLMPRPAAYLTVNRQFFGGVLVLLISLGTGLKCLEIPEKFAIMFVDPARNPGADF
jgi:hypothetical protein